MSKSVRHLFLFTLLALLLLTNNVCANSESAGHPLDNGVLSVAGQGYVVLIFKGFFGVADYFSFGEDNTFTLGSEVRSGSGDYVIINNSYFSAQYSGTKGGENFSYAFNGLNFWGFCIWGEGEYTIGSTTEQLTFSGITSFLFAPFSEEP